MKLVLVYTRLQNSSRDKRIIDLVTLSLIPRIVESIDLIKLFNRFVDQIG